VSQPEPIDLSFRPRSYFWPSGLDKQLLAKIKGVAARLYESPYTDHAQTRPEAVFPETEVDGIVDILDTVRANASPADGAA
jgi:hypothetical protein